MIFNNFIKMKYITFSLPNTIKHLIIYNLSYPLNILMIMCLFYYSILQFETKIVAIKKINICLFFKDIFQVIIFFSFYHIEKKKSKLTRRETILSIEEKFDDKVLLTKKKLMTNPDKNLELRMQKDKIDIIKIILIIMVIGISDFFNEKLLYVFGPGHDFFRKIYFIMFICLNYLSIYFSNKLIQNNFPLYKHQKLSLFIISAMSFLCFFIMIIILIVLIKTNNDSIGTLYLIFYTFPLSIINGIKFVLQKEILEKDYMSEYFVLGYVGVVKFFLHIFSNITASNYFRYLDGFSYFFSRNNFLFYTLICSFIFIFSFLLSDFCLLHILYIFNPDHSLLAIQNGIILLFVIHFIYLIFFGGELIISNIFMFIVLLLHIFSGLVYNEVVILKFNGLDEHTKINLKVNERIDKLNCNLLHSNSSISDISISKSGFSK